MVMADRNLLRDVRRMAIRAEAAAMQLRGRLVVGGPVWPATPPAGNPGSDSPPDPRRRTG
jgi:hypothetical protein